MSDTPHRPPQDRTPKRDRATDEFTARFLFPVRGLLKLNQRDEPDPSELMLDKAVDAAAASRQSSENEPASGQDEMFEGANLGTPPRPKRTINRSDPLPGTPRFCEDFLRTKISGHLEKIGYDEETVTEMFSEDSRWIPLYLRHERLVSKWLEKPIQSHHLRTDADIRELVSIGDALGLKRPRKLQEISALPYDPSREITAGSSDITGPEGIEEQPELLIKPLDRFLNALRPHLRYSSEGEWVYPYVRGTEVLVSGEGHIIKPIEARADQKPAEPLEVLVTRLLTKALKEAGFDISNLGQHWHRITDPGCINLTEKVVVESFKLEHTLSSSRTDSNEYIRENATKLGEAMGLPKAAAQSVTDGAPTMRQRIAQELAAKGKTESEPAATDAAETSPAQPDSTIVPPDVFERMRYTRALERGAGRDGTN